MTEQACKTLLHFDGRHGMWFAAVEYRGYPAMAVRMPALLGLLLPLAGAQPCGTYCEDNGHDPDTCGCGVCGSYGEPQPFVASSGAP